MLGVYVVSVEVLGVDETNAVGFVVDRDLAADGTADIGVLVLLADLPVAVGDDVVCIAVDAEEARDLGYDAGLLQAFTYRALRGGLADLLGSAWQRPLTRIPAALEKDSAVVVNDEQVARRDESIGLRRVRIVVVLGPSHTGPPQRRARARGFSSWSMWRAAASLLADRDSGKSEDGRKEQGNILQVWEHCVGSGSAQLLG